MSELISRADAIEAIASRDETDGTVKVFTGREVNEILSALPSTEPKTGKWAIEERDCIYGQKYILTCSECGDAVSVTESSLPHEKYCRNCGSRMKGAER